MLDPEKIGPHTLKAAQWAADLSFEDIPTEVITFAKRSILDGMGCSVRGTLMEAGRFILSYVGNIAGEAPEASIWGTDIRVTARLAGMINGATAQTPNTGDDHHASGIHTNYLMPQTAIALAEKEGRTGRDVLTAYVAGNEIAVRAAMAVHVLGEGGYFDSEGRGWQSTGSMGPNEGIDAGYHKKFDDGEGSSYLYWVGDDANTNQFEDVLKANQNKLSFWFGGHTHTFPDDTFGDKGLVEQRWGVTFCNASALTRHHGSFDPATRNEGQPKRTAAPMSRLLTFTEGSNEALLRCYLHTSDYAPQGWHVPQERTIKLPRPFQFNN